MSADAPRAPPKGVGEEARRAHGPPGPEASGRSPPDEETAPKEPRFPAPAGKRTERLDLVDPYLVRFEARVLEVRDRGGRPAVVLDRSAFYPEGGGQPSDRGTLASAPVVDVVEEGGTVLHVLDGPAPEGAVVGLVDWARRFDHMQQHHGQHLLSAAFERLWQARTVSFHLGEETCTIDLDRPVSEMGSDRLRAAEAAASEFVWRDLEVTARDHSPEEMARLPLRKEAVKGARLVVVRDDRPGASPEPVDVSPCGGTHPRRTGEVGAVAVLGAVKWGSGTRVEFACGARVLRLLGQSRQLVADSSRVLRCATSDLPAAVEKLSLESTARRKESERLLLALAGAEAARLAGASAAPAPVTAELAPPLASPEGLRAVAQALAGLGRTAFLGAAGESGAHLCFARPRGSGPHLGEVLRGAAQAAGGKGGGAPDLAQGSVPDIGSLRRVLYSASGSAEDPGA